MTGRKAIRCAVYTRKSSEHNLDLEFNSLDAQREACEAYIKSQIHEGWVLIPDHYDDGGISGGSMNRPDLQRLLSDIRAGKVDIVVVYKVDRLTRSLADFAKLVELFDAQGVSFVSVTQAFNTTNSMGRLTLNILLSFAQFEREVIGERVRDKVAASKAKGLWMGGNVPLGYINRDKKLLVHLEEAETVRFIFKRYLELGSVGLLIRDLRQLRVLTKRREGASGRVSGGVPFGKGALIYLLRNRHYIGEIAHRGQIHAAAHEPILDRELFEAAQAKLQENAVTRRLNLRSPPYLLTGLLYDSAGNRMSPSHTVKKGVRYRYYISQGLLQNRELEDLGEVTRVSAAGLEEAVARFLHEQVRVTGEISDALQSHCKKIVVRTDGLEMHLTPKGVSAQPGQEFAGALILPWEPRSTRREKGIAHAPAQASNDSHKCREALLSAIANARRWLKAILEGAAVGDVAKSAGLGQRQFRTLLNLAFVPPTEVRALMAGSAQPATITERARRVALRWPGAPEVPATSKGPAQALRAR